MAISSVTGCRSVASRVDVAAVVWLTRWARAAAAASLLGVMVGLAAGWPATWVVLAVLVPAAGVVAWWDVELRRIPNAVSLALVVVAAVCAVGFDEVSWASVGVGLVLTAGPLLVLHLLDPSWVGFGDVKFLAALGAVFGVVYWPAGMAVLWGACVLALMSRPFVAASWRRSVPFGFWSSFAAVVAASVLVLVG